MPESTLNARELTREQVVAILLRPLEAKSVFLAANPRIFDTDGSPVRVPKLGGAIADPGWTGENELIPERDVEFDEVTLLPSTMKSVKVLTRFSNELARQSIVSLDATLRDRLVSDVAAKYDAQFLSAGGDGVTTPRGLFAHAGIQTLAVGGELTLDTLLAAWGMALTANVDMARLRWLMTPREFIALRKIKDGNQRYQLQPDPTQDGVFRLFGAPVVISGRIPDTQGGTPTGRAALVDFSQIGVARDVFPTVKILDQTFGQWDQQAIRVVSRADAKPLNAEAIVALTGIAI